MRATGAGAELGPLHFIYPYVCVSCPLEGACSLFATWCLDPTGGADDAAAAATVAAAAAAAAMVGVVASAASVAAGAVNGVAVAVRSLVRWRDRETKRVQVG